MQTGEAHWHVLIRARAIENGSFVFAAAQCGKHESGRETYGHSLIVDPWGRILAEGGVEPGVVMAEIDLGGSRQGALANPLAAARPPFRDRRAAGGAGASARGRGRRMIRYALVCDKGHAFESWFANSAAYDKQAKRGLVSCPHCGSAKVDKAIMAPRLAGAARRAAPSKRRPAAPETAAPEKPQEKAPVAMMSPQERELRAKLKELRDHLTKNADNVGPKFPEEARKMHYGEIEHRSIYGEASPDDAKALAEEGIEFHPLPILPDERN